MKICAVCDSGTCKSCDSSDIIISFDGTFGNRCKGYCRCILECVGIPDDATYIIGTGYGDLFSVESIFGGFRGCAVIYFSEYSAGVCGSGYGRFFSGVYQLGISLYIGFVLKTSDDTAGMIRTGYG